MCIDIDHFLTYFLKKYPGVKPHETTPLIHGQQTEEETIKPPSYFSSKHCLKYTLMYIFHDDVNFVEHY